MHEYKRRVKVPCVHPHNYRGKRKDAIQELCSLQGWMKAKRFLKTKSVSYWEDQRTHHLNVELPPYNIVWAEQQCKGDCELQNKGDWSCTANHSSDTGSCCTSLLCRPKKGPLCLCVHPSREPQACLWTMSFKFTGPVFNAALISTVLPVTRLPPRVASPTAPNPSLLPLHSCLSPCKALPHKWLERECFWQGFSQL